MASWQNRHDQAGAVFQQDNPHHPMEREVKPYRDLTERFTAWARHCPIGQLPLVQVAPNDIGQFMMVALEGVWR